MGDSGNLTKDKHHRSTVSLLGPALVKKLSATASKPEFDDQFAIAEARCGELKQKLDIVKALKRRKKLKKRSYTKVSDADREPIQMISVRPKTKRASSVQAGPGPTAVQSVKDMTDSGTMDHHRPLQQYNHNTHYIYEEENQHDDNKKKSWSPQLRRRKSQNVEENKEAHPRLVSSKSNKPVQDNNTSTEDNQYSQSQNPSPPPIRKKLLFHQRSTKSENRRSPPPDLRSGSSKPKEGLVELFNKDQVKKTQDKSSSNRNALTPSPRKERNMEHYNRENEESAIVENSRPKQVVDDSCIVTRQHIQDYTTNYDDNIMNVKKRLRKGRLRLQRYEMPTVSSQLKASALRTCGTYSVCAQSKIPFVATKSCAPSHNIGVNLQQVLNGLKMQQPIGGIPLTIAHHMGLRHLPYVTKSEANTTSLKPTLDVRDINVIHLGDRLLHLPSYKFMSYRRLLEMYKEGEGMVPRFLRSKNKQSYIYANILAQSHGDDDSCTSKLGQETKQLLGEYATLYSEFERLERNIKDGDRDHESQLRRDNLVKFLAAREEQIRRMIKNYKPLDGHLHSSISISCERNSLQKIKDSQLSMS